MSKVQVENAALAYILNCYAQQIDALRPAKDVPSTPKAKAERKARTPKVVKAEVKSYVPSFAYEAHSIGAEGFFKLLRSARSRTEEIDAINAYCGFSHHENFGTQLDSARRAAHLSLHSNLGHRSARSTVAGYVKGSVDLAAKQRADLCGREVMAASNLIDHENTARAAINALTDPYLSSAKQADLEATRDLAMGLAAVERSRIEVIREDLARLA